MIIYVSAYFLFRLRFTKYFPTIPSWLTFHQHFPCPIIVLYGSPWIEGYSSLAFPKSATVVHSAYSYSQFVQLLHAFVTCSLLIAKEITEGSTLFAGYSVNGHPKRKFHPADFCSKIKEINMTCPLQPGKLHNYTGLITYVIDYTCSN